MKALITRVSCCMLLLLASWSAHAGSLSVADVSCLEEQLTTAAWQLDPSTQWQFEDDGFVFLLNHDARRYEMGEWDLHRQGNATLLTISFGQEEMTYQMDGRCGQPFFHLSSEFAGEFDLTQTSKSNQLLNWLPGDWQVGFAPGGLQYSFQTNGHFECMSQTGNAYHVNTGRWTIARDGETLVLYTAQGQIQVLSIKHLQMDELVLSPIMGHNEIAPAKAGEDWFLNKL